MQEVLHRIKDVPISTKASFAFLVCNFMQRGISVLTTPIFTRLLTAGQYGYYSIFNSWLDIISVFTTLKLAGGVFTQALVKFDGRRDEFAASTAGLGTVATLLFALLYIPLRHRVNRLLGLTPMMMACILAASWSTLMFELWSTRQRVECKYKALIALTLFVAVAKPVLGIIAVVATQIHKAEARIVAITLVEFLSFVGIFVIFLKRGRRFFNKQFWLYSLSLNIPLIPHYLTRTALNYSDRLMISAMVGLDKAGVYSLAHSLAWLQTLLTSAILNTFNPWSYQQMKDKNFAGLAQVSYKILALIAASGLCIISVAPEIVSIFAPPEYYEAIWIIPPVTVSVYFLFMYNLYANFEFYYEKTYFMTVASAIGGLLNVILNYVFIKRSGYLAAGYTTLFCYVFYAVSHYFCMKRITTVKLGRTKIYNMRIIVGLSSAYILAALAIMLVYDKPYSRYGAIFACCSFAWTKRKFLMSFFA